MGKIIDCGELATKIKDEVVSKIQERTKYYKENGNEYVLDNLSLTVFSNPNDVASKVYIKNKRKACEYCGIKFKEIPIDENFKLEDKYKMLLDLQQYIVQLPTANQEINELLMHTTTMDADGLADKSYVTPCTAKGVLKIIDSVDYDLEGKKVVLLGRSKLCNKPLINLLLDRNATVVVIHSKTKQQHLIQECHTADVIISAVGKPHFVTKDMVRPNQFIIDVGINRDENGKLCGDVDFEDVKDIVEYITPVPGGVGKLTVACLIENVFEIWDRTSQSYIIDRLCF